MVFGVRIGGAIVFFGTIAIEGLYNRPIAETFFHDYRILIALAVALFFLFLLAGFRIATNSVFKRYSDIDIPNFKTALAWVYSYFIILGSFMPSVHGE